MAEYLHRNLSADHFEALLSALANGGYSVYGPTVRDGAIVYDQVAGMRDLPRGYSDTQDPGRYRLEPRQGDALFGYTLGPQSWKKFLHPPQVKLLEARRDNGVFRILNGAAISSRPAAFVGVRACEVAAIAIQDRVLTTGPYRDSVYQARRDRVFLVAVQCTRSVATCFCASMGTGPQVPGGRADIALTEIAKASEHWFLAQAGSDRGEELLSGLGASPASQEDRCTADAAVRAAATGQKRTLDTTGIRELFHQNFEHPRWDHVAERCLACANCTMVCPTCFCTTVEDVSDVTGQHAERWRRWDSCFTTGFSYIHGGSVRTSGKARYRQWIAHKLATWIDQFGSSGCVGCGRCITWCPAGIDITEEAQVIRGAANHGNTNT